MITNSIKALDKERQKILSKMYVSNVKNRLREMDTPSETDCKRWIWELMQNAKDSISGTDRKTVDVKLEINDSSWDNSENYYISNYQSQLNHFINSMCIYILKS